MSADLMFGRRQREGAGPKIRIFHSSHVKWVLDIGGISRGIC